MQTNGDHVEVEQEHRQGTVVRPVPTTPGSKDRSDPMPSAAGSATGPHGEKRMSSMFFVVQTLEGIQNAKEGKRKGPLKETVAKALGNMQRIPPRLNSFYRLYQVPCSLIPSSRGHIRGPPLGVSTA